MALLSLPISTQHPPLSLQLLQSDYQISVLPCCGPWPGAEQSLASSLCRPLRHLAVLCHTRCSGKTNPSKWDRFSASQPYPGVPGTEDKDLEGKDRDPVCPCSPCLSPYSQQPPMSPELVSQAVWPHPLSPGRLRAPRGSLILSGWTACPRVGIRVRDWSCRPHLLEHGPMIRKTLFIGQATHMQR